MRSPSSSAAPDGALPRPGVAAELGAHSIQPGSVRREALMHGLPERLCVMDKSGRDCDAARLNIRRTFWTASMLGFRSYGSQAWLRRPTSWRSGCEARFEGTKRDAHI